MRNLYVPIPYQGQQASTRLSSWINPRPCRCVSVLCSRCDADYWFIAYAAACLSEGNAILAANQTALVLPRTWDGPFVAILPIGGVAATVIVGAVIGLSALLILSNL